MSDQKQETPRRSIQDFFDNEYCEFAKYTITSRAIPSVIDGFKPTQRKVAHAANKVWKTGNEKPLKVFQLAGTVAATTFYHHGNASLESTIIAMAQDFKNSMPIFKGIGQFGSIRSPEAGAARYVGVQFNENFRLLYKDFDLTAPQFEEGEEIEPKYFLPIIPTVLLNGGSGIAVGFATNIMNRKPIDLIDACLLAIDDKEIPELKPWIKGFNGTFTRAIDNPNSWIIKGCYTVKNTSTVEITDLPPDLTYEKYEAHLDALVEKGTIASYDDNSSGNISYTLKFPRTTLAELSKRGKLEDSLKLLDRDSENITTLDENGKLKVFKNAQEIVRYFVDFRLGYYTKRKTHLLAQVADELKTLSNRAKFIKMIVDGELKINSRKKAEIEADLAKIGFDTNDGSYVYLTSMPIHALTQEKIDEINKSVETKLKEQDKVNKTAPTDMYRTDLKDLRKKVS